MHGIMLRRVRRLRARREAAAAGRRRRKVRRRRVRVRVQRARRTGYYAGCSGLRGQARGGACDTPPSQLAT